MKSLSDTELGDDSTIALDVLLGQVVQQLAALTNHLVQAAAAVVVVDVDPQVLSKLLDTGGKNGDLHLRGAGVGLMGAVASITAVFWSLRIMGEFHLSKNFPAAE